MTGLLELNRSYEDILAIQKAKMMASMLWWKRLGNNTKEPVSRELIKEGARAGLGNRLAVGRRGINL